MQLRDQLSVMKSDRMRKETQMNEMELALTQKSGEVSHVQQQLQQVLQHSVTLTSTILLYKKVTTVILSKLSFQMQAESANIQSRNQAENESRIQDLNKQIADYQDHIARSQAEVIFCLMFCKFFTVLKIRTMIELHRV